MRERGFPEAADFWKNLTVLVVCRALSAPASLLGAALAARLLGPVDFGVYSLLMSWVQVFFVGTIGWRSDSVVRFGKVEWMERGKLASIFTANLVLIGAGLMVAGILTYLASGSLGRIIGVPVGYVHFVILLVAGLAMSDLFGYMLQASSEMNGYGYTTILDKIVFAAILASLYAIHGNVGMLDVLVAFFISKVCQIVFALKYLWNRFEFALSGFWSTLRNVWRYSFPVLLFFPGALISEWADIWVIRYYLSKGDVGIYQTAYQGLLFLTQMVMVVNIVLFPLIVRLRSGGRLDLIKSFYGRFAPWAIAMWGFLLGGVGILGDELFTITFGAKYSSGGEAFRILISTAAFVGVSGSYSPLLSGFDRKLPMMVATFLSALANFLLDILLVPALGIMGAAVATWIAYLGCSYTYMVAGENLLGRTGRMKIAWIIPNVVLISFGFLTSNLLLRFMAIIVVGFFLIRLLRSKCRLDEKDLGILNGVPLPRSFAKLAGISS